MTGRRILIFAALLAIAGLAWGCQNHEEPSSQAAPLALAITPSTYSGLIPIADDLELFHKAGLAVTLRKYPSGLAALNGVSAGEAQVGTAADFAFISKLKDDPSLRIVASIGLSNTDEVVARKDRGITSPADLRGKRIGVSLGTTAEFYLDAFLLAHSIAPSEVTRVDIAPDKLVEAVVAGEVDGISSWDVHVYQAKQRLGGNGVFWPAQNSQNYHWLLVARESFIQSSPDTIRRLLRALVQAEQFALDHSNEAQAIVMRWWGFEPEFIRHTWGGTRLTVSLGQSLVTSLESGLRWQMKKGGRAGDLPNVLEYIYPNALDEVDPRAVTILR